MYLKGEGNCWQFIFMVMYVNNNINGKRFLGKFCSRKSRERERMKKRKRSIGQMQKA